MGDERFQMSECLHARWWLSTLLLAALVCAPGRVAYCSDHESRNLGALVDSIELRSKAPVGQGEDLWELVELEVGTRITGKAVRRTLQNLQASGVIGEAEIHLQALGETVRAVIAVYPKLQVSSIGFEGDLCVRRSILESRIQQIEATPVSESRLIRGVYRLQDALVEEGYLGARVRLNVSVDSVRHAADVRYVVECGEPTLIESVSFEGDRGPFAVEELIEKLRLTSGKRLQKERLPADARRLEEWLVRSGYRLADIGEPRVEQGTGSGQVTLTYAIDLGPRFELSIIGADEDLLRRKKVLDLLEREKFDEALVLQALNGIRRFYQERGHHGIEVDWRSEQESGVFLLEITVRKGPVSRIAEITFSGNEILEDDELAVRMDTRPAKVFGASGYLVSEQLEDDLANLRAHYARRGFPGARVGPAEVRGVDEALFVDIPIEEGLRYRLVDLSFEGVRDPAIRSLLTRLPLEPGGPFHERLLEETLDEIRAVYENAGYLSAQVTAEFTSETDSILKSVQVRVLEGPQVRLGRVILRGNVRTRGHVVRRSLGLRPGDTLSRRVLLRAQQNLYRLGIFSRAEVRLAPTMPFAKERDVLVRVEEGRSQRASFGLGYDSEDGVRTLLGYSHSNLGGSAVSMRFDLRVSEREEQFRALLRQPYLGRWSVPVTYSLFAVEEEQESFDSRRKGAQVEGHRQLDNSRVGLLYTYKAVEVLERPGVPLFRLGIDRNLQDAEISSLTPSVLLDHRDDPLIPTHGWTLNLQSEIAFPLLSAEAEFIKLFGQGTMHWSLGELGVIAGSLRLGSIEPVDADATDPESLVPISEQFFAGGRTTHRAYERDLLGTYGETLFLCHRDTNVCAGEIPAGESSSDYRRVAVGGNGIVLFNLDYRFPLAGPLGGTLFVDGGNVWTKWADIDLGEIKVGGGLGLRYLSPIGPLRLEVGWKLDREVGESARVVFLSFGNPF
jgi:outer membrane protein insertion porin family